MIEIKGGFFNWPQEALKNSMSKVLKGATLTINSKSKEAWIYDGEMTCPVSVDYANLLVTLNVVGCDSGNFETGERHYNIYNR